MRTTGARTPDGRHLSVIPEERRPFSARAALVVLLWLIATAAAAQRPHHTLPLAPLLHAETTDAGTLLVSEADANGARIAFALLRPDVPISWADAAGQDAFLAQAVVAADAAVQAGRTGLALDLDADSSRHAVTWAGYDPAALVAASARPSTPARSKPTGRWRSCASKRTPKRLASSGTPSSKAWSTAHRPATDPST